MITVVFCWHNSGNTLRFVERPWWTDPLDSLVQHLICPCCSWRGWLMSKLPERLQDLWFDAWSKAMNWLDSFDIEKGSIPYGESCSFIHPVYGDAWCLDCPEEDA